MSSNGGDDIDDLTRELRRTNERLDRLINAIVAGAREQEPEDVGRKIDLWDEGRRSAGTANGPDEYVRMRGRAATSETISPPRVSARDLVRVYLEVYRRGGEHLDKINNSLNNSQWKRFIQELSIEYGAEEELVEILNPDPIFFAVEEVEGEITVIVEDTHMNFMRAYRSYWYVPDIFDIPAEGEEMMADFLPWDALGMSVDPEREILIGELDPVDVNKEMARAIDDTPGKSLPDRFEILL